jgi:hypothetical protein
LAWKYLNGTSKERFDYAFKLNYGGVGEATFYINISVNTTTAATPIDWVYAGMTAGATGVKMDFENKTEWSSNFETTPLQFMLGASAGSSEDYELNVTTEGTGSQGAGKKSQEIVDDSGLLIQSPSSNTGSDYVVFKVPNKYLAVHAHFGLPTGATTGEGAYHVISPVTSSLAVLDTEVTATHKAKNLVSVGGPVINKITAEALGVDATLGGVAIAAQLGIASGEALIQVVSDYPATGLYTVVVAGYEAANTRAACTVLQQFDTLLKGQTATKVKVTGTVTAPVVTPVTATTTTTTAATTTTTAT